MCHSHLILMLYSRVIVSLNHSLSFSIKPFAQPPYPSLSGPVPQSITSKYGSKICGKFFSKWSQKGQNFINACAHPGYEPLAPPPAPTATAVPVWQDRTIASSKLRMLEYSAFMEVQRDPDNVSENSQQGFPHTDILLLTERA